MSGYRNTFVIFFFFIGKLRLSVPDMYSSVEKDLSVGKFLDLKVSMKLNVALMQMSCNWRSTEEKHHDDDNCHHCTIVQSW